MPNGKYYPLERHLRQQKLRRLSMSFKDIENLIDDALPPTAYTNPEWWANENVAKTRHVQCRAWQNEGYRVVAVDLKNQRVTFEKI